MATRFGYACINMALNSQKPRVSSNRGMIKRTWLSKGLPYASELALKNTTDLVQIIAWNNAHNIKVFRISSCLFPWMSEYEFEQLPDIDAIKANLELAGELARNANQRLSFHPGQFCVLASKTDKVVKSAVNEINKTAQIMDMLGMPKSPGAKINIHLGGAYGDRQASMDRWCKNFELLQDSAQARLTVENDDKASMYSTKMLYEGIHKRIGIPIVFDSHHFANGPQDTSYEDAFLMAVDSWPKGIRPQCHHSNDRKKYEDPTTRPQAHTDWYYEPFNDLGFDVDVVLECKKKEKALFKYLKDFVDTEDRIALAS